MWGRWLGERALGSEATRRRSGAEERSLDHLFSQLVDERRERPGEIRDPVVEGVVKMTDEQAAGHLRAAVARWSTRIVAWKAPNTLRQTEATCFGSST